MLFFEYGVFWAHPYGYGREIWRLEILEDSRETRYKGWE